MARKPKPHRGRPFGARSRPRCDCGRFARYRIPTAIMLAELNQEIHIELLLCERCYGLECMIQHDLGKAPPHARQLG